MPGRKKIRESERIANDVADDESLVGSLGLASTVQTQNCLASRNARAETSMLLDTFFAHL